MVKHNSKAVLAPRNIIDIARQVPVKMIFVFSEKSGTYRQKGQSGKWVMEF